MLMCLLNDFIYYFYRSVEDQIRQVKLRTSDQVTICVKIDVVRCSLTILSKYSSLDLEANELLIDLPEINSCILEKVIEWSTFHKVCNWLYKCIVVYKNNNRAYSVIYAYE